MRDAAQLRSPEARFDWNKKKRTIGVSSISYSVGLHFPECQNLIKGISLLIVSFPGRGELLSRLAIVPFCSRSSHRHGHRCRTVETTSGRGAPPCCLGDSGWRLYVHWNVALWESTARRFSFFPYSFALSLLRTRATLECWHAQRCMCIISILAPIRYTREWYFLSLAVKSGFAYFSSCLS